MAAAVEPEPAAAVVASSAVDTAVALAFAVVVVAEPAAAAEPAVAVVATPPQRWAEHSPRSEFGAIHSQAEVEAPVAAQGTSGTTFRPSGMSSWAVAAAAAEYRDSLLVDVDVVVGVAVDRPGSALLWEILVRFAPGSGTPCGSSASRHSETWAPDVPQTDWSRQSFAGKRNRKTIVKIELFNFWRM